MADPLSTTLGILSFIIQVTEIAKDAKGAKGDRRTLLAGLHSLKFLVEVLKERLEDDKGDESWSRYARLMQEGSGTITEDENGVTYEPPVPPQEPKGPLAELYRTIAKLSAKLKPPSTGQHWESVKARFRKLGWKWEKDDFRQMLIDIARAQGQVSFILDQDEYELLKNIKVDTANIVSTTAQTYDLVQGMKQAEDNEKNIRERQKIEQWLSSLDFNKQKELREDYFPSGKTLFASFEFKQWIQGQKWHLWCYGKPRSGKTVLSSIIAHHLQSKSSSTSPAVVCLFFNWEDHRQDVPQNVLGSLLKQLFQQTPTAPINPELSQAAENGDTPRIPQIEQYMKDLLKFREQDQAYFILDGWDQCKPEVQIALRDSFEGLRHEVDNLSILYTTRLVDDVLPSGKQVVCNECGKADLKIYFHCDICDDGEFDVCFDCVQKSPQKQPACKDPSHELSEQYDDVFVNVDMPREMLEEYVNLELKREIESGSKRIDRRLNQNRPFTTHFGRILQEHSSLRRKIPPAVGEKAGSFLHAKLFLDALRGMRGRKQIEQALKEFPINLDEVYLDAIKRIQQMRDFERKLGLKTLRFLACASRPPSLEELRNALAVMFQLEDEDEKAQNEDEEDPTSDEGSHISFKDDDIGIWKDDILKTTAGLIDISEHEDAVQLSHPSIRNSFIKDQTSFQDAQKDIAILCLDYLNNRTFSKPSENDVEFEIRRDSNPFLAYATQNWAKHVEKAIDDELVKERAIRILRDHARIDAILQAQWNTDSSPGSWDVLTGLDGLHICARFGLHALIPALVRKIDDVNVKERVWQTPLMYACREGQTATIERLLDLDASVNLISKLGRTALFEAILNGHLSPVDALLNRKYAQLDINQAAGDPNTTALMLAVSQGRKKIAARLLKHIDIKADSQNEDGLTALMIAAMSEQTDLVQVLLDSANAGVNLADKENRTALHFASLWGYTDIVSILLQSGADPELKDSDGNNALMEAIKQEQLGAMQLLLGCVKDFGSRDSQGREAIHLASEKGWSALVGILIDKGVDPNSQDESGLTPLHYAASKGFVDVVKVLIKKGAISTINDVLGKTSADFAAAQGFKETLQELGHRVGSPTAMDEPLWRLARDGRLTQNELDSRRTELVETEPITKNSALHCAVQGGQADVLQMLLENGGMDPNLRRSDGTTPLLLAADYGYLACVQILLKSHADPNLADRLGNTPLAIASGDWPLDVAIALVEAGAAIKQRDAVVQRFFFGAVGLGNLAATKILLRLGADPLQRHEIGMTAQQIARKCGNEDLVQLLKEAEQSSNSESHLEGAERDEIEKDFAMGHSLTLTQRLSGLTIDNDAPSAEIDRSLFLVAETERVKASKTSDAASHLESHEALSNKLPTAPTNKLSSHGSNRMKKRLLA